MRGTEVAVESTGIRPIGTEACRRESTPIRTIRLVERAEDGTESTSEPRSGRAMRNDRGMTIADMRRSAGMSSRGRVGMRTL